MSRMICVFTLGPESSCFFCKFQASECDQVRSNIFASAASLLSSSSSRNKQLVLFCVSCFYKHLTCEPIHQTNESIPDDYFVSLYDKIIFQPLISLHSNDQDNIIRNRCYQFVDEQTSCDMEYHYIIPRFAISKVLPISQSLQEFSHLYIEELIPLLGIKDYAIGQKLIHDSNIHYMCVAAIDFYISTIISSDESLTEKSSILLSMYNTNFTNSDSVRFLFQHIARMLIDPNCDVTTTITTTTTMSLDLILSPHNGIHDFNNHYNQNNNNNNTLYVEHYPASPVFNQLQMELESENKIVMRHVSIDQEFAVHRKRKYTKKSSNNNSHYKQKKAKTKSTAKSLQSHLPTPTISFSVCGIPVCFPAHLCHLDFETYSRNVASYNS